jgi:hypothetical protein
LFPVKGRTGGPDAKTASKGNADMTTHHSTTARPFSVIFSSVARATAQFFEYRAQKARLASDMKLLLAMDSHMLNDIGLPGFNRLAPAQQESLLRDTIWLVTKS